MVGIPATWHEEFLGRLKDLRRSIETVRIRAGGLWFLASFLGVTSIGGLIEMFATLEPPWRTALVVSLGVVCFLLFGGFVVLPFLRRLGVIRSLSDQHLARVVGAVFPQIQDRLVNLLQLYTQDRGPERRYSSELIDAAGRELAAEIRPLDLRTAVDRSPVRLARRGLSIAAVAAVVLLGLFPRSFTASLDRLLHFDVQFASLNAVEFSFETETDQILKGSAFSAIVRVHPASPNQDIDLGATLTFLWQPEDQASPDRIVLQPESAGVYRATIPDVRSNAVYRARFNGYESDLHALTVLDPPALRSFRVRLDYPRYTGLPPKLQEEFVGDIAALPGTMVTLTGSASKELASAEVRFSDGIPRPAEVLGRSFTVRFPVTVTTGYTLALTDQKSLDLPDPIAYSIVLIDDEPPTIELLQPGRNLDIAGEGVLPLLARISDDYGFSSLRLAYRLTQSRYERPWPAERFLNIPLPTGTRTAADISYAWSLEPLDLVPEDVVEYAIEVFDNDVVRGPKSARTPLFLLRLPSLDEVFADADNTQHLSLDEMRQSLQETEELKETLDQIEQDMKQNKPLDWQQQKTLEELSKKYDEIQKSITAVQDELERMIASMQQQDALTGETLEKYLELQELFEQLDSAELQQALQQLQQAMQNVNRQQLQEAMQQLKFSEDRFRASIERTINLLKRIQIEQKLDEAIRRADDLRLRQSELRDATSDSREAFAQQEIARQQEDLERAQRSLEASTREVQERMEEFFAEMPLDRMEDLNQQLSQQQLVEQMQRAARQLRGGQPQSAQQTQSQIVQQLDNLSDDLRAIQQQLLEQQSQYTINALRQAAQNLLELSKRQEGLKNESANASANSPGIRQNAQEQRRMMEALTKIAQNLAELGQRSFAVTPQMARSVGEALRAMQNALGSLDMRNGQAAARNQTDAMGALNSSAMAAQDALEALMQGGSGGGPGGLMQQLQALAGQQQSLNARTQSMEAAAQAARLAAEQAAIQKSLEQLHQEAQRAGEEDRLLGDLDRVAQEMNEVVRALEQQNINPETLQRQERILSRLLDASRSMRERDFEKRRKATTGTAVARTGPPELEDRMRGGQDQLRQDLLRALEQGYSKEYEELIRKYFEQLERLQRERP